MQYLASSEIRCSICSLYTPGCPTCTERVRRHLRTLLEVHLSVSRPERWQKLLSPARRLSRDRNDRCQGRDLS